MEGYSEDFLNFIKFILIFAVVFYIGNILKKDMASRGVFGVEKQMSVTKKPIQKEIFSNNPATIRYAW
ncbi:MAG: hypothetical protein WC229_00730 [Candidatus Paceibacterota bacterium]|jgi:hypothetical protein